MLVTAEKANRHRESSYPYYSQPEARVPEAEPQKKFFKIDPDKPPKQMYACHLPCSNIRSLRSSTRSLQRIVSFSHKFDGS